MSVIDRTELSRRKQYLESCSEKLLMDTALQVLKLRGWMVTHFRPARSAAGWVTPLTGDPGFPDICAAKGGKLLLVEVKSQRGQLTPGQMAWRQAIDSEASIDVSYWLLRPSNLDEFIEAVSK